MTIASEITRLQWAKANMKTAIVNKWVSVADSVSLSNYCDCINAIQSWGLDLLNVAVQSWWYATISYPTNWSYWITDAAWGCKYTSWDYKVHCYTEDWFFIPLYNSWDKAIQYLAVWWWGAWWVKWWGWWWEVLCGVFVSNLSSFNIVVWCKWCYCCTTWWWHSCIWTKVIAHWWCKNNNSVWWMSWSWCAWWWLYGACAAWGGWWASEAWCKWWICGSGTCYCWWSWWAGKYWYWGWWGWWSSRYRWGASDGWWCWWCGFSCPTLPTNCWWGGGWHCTMVARSNWAGWVVDICYPANWSYWFSCATWWTKSLCDGMCVHRFTSDWTFTIVS